MARKIVRRVAGVCDLRARQGLAHEHVVPDTGDAVGELEETAARRLDGLELILA